MTTNIIEIPESVDVFVPKLNTTVAVPIGTAAPDVVLHLLTHGLKQKLVDSTAGINLSDFPSPAAYESKLRETVDARLATVLTIPAGGGFGRGPRGNPVETECRAIVAAILQKRGKMKSAAAREMTSTFAKAKEAFMAMVQTAYDNATKASGEPRGAPDKIAAMLERNWVNTVYNPAVKTVESRKPDADLDVAV